MSNQGVPICGIGAAKIAEKRDAVFPHVIMVLLGILEEDDDMLFG